MNIGVFDSGRGGRLIARKINVALPQAKIIYRSDPENFPYGNKSADFIFKRLVYFTNIFQKQNCSLIVIACNSATTNVISRLRRRFPKTKFVGIEPPIKPCASLTRTNKIAIIGTTATINSQRYQELARNYPHLQIFNVACLGLAEAIENKQPIIQLLKRFLTPAVKAGADVIGLACTHYPYVLPEMKKLFPQITFYDPADAVVKRVMSIINS